MSVLRYIIGLLLRLRYRITVKGLAAIQAKGTDGILFLPNHPALIDPVIVSHTLNKAFKPRPVADEMQANRFGVRTLVRAVNALILPNMRERGKRGRDLVRSVFASVVKALGSGDNILLYPAGRLARSRQERLGNNSGVHTILEQYPGVRVVLVRTTGLWGSRFSWGGPSKDAQAWSLVKVITMGVWDLLKSAVLFLPKRDITIECIEPADLPRDSDRRTLNRFLESFYNANDPQRTLVPYSLWTPCPARTVADEGESISGLAA